MQYETSFIVYPLRNDINIFRHEIDGEEVLIFADTQGIASQELIIPASLIGILQIVSRAMTLENLHQEVERMSGEEVDIAELREIFTTLDQAFFLESPRYQKRKKELVEQFLGLDIRPAACAGNSYPDNPALLESMFDAAFQAVSPSSSLQASSVILSPHIDLRVGLSSYVAPFRALAKAHKQQAFDTIFVIATSHYGWQDIVIPTEKHFETPFGIMQTDREFLHQFRKQLSFDLTRNDIAHKDEHSIEFEILALQYILRQPGLSESLPTIVPLLVTSFEPFVQQQKHPKTSTRYSEIVTALRKLYYESGKKCGIIISGDLSHVGTKFGDTATGKDMESDVRAADEKILQALRTADSEVFFQTIASQGDRYRVCGLSPVTLALDIVSISSGETFGYQYWNEISTESAVSFVGAAWT